MHGLQRVLRMYGKAQCGDVMWVWDYANEKPMREKEMTKAMRLASDKAFGELLKQEITP